MSKIKIQELCSLPFFGSPPLLPGEDTDAYEQLLTLVAETVKASDVLEMIWVRDFVDLEWEIRRLRRIKANLLRIAAPPAAAFEPMLASHVADIDAHLALAVSEKISPLERIDRIIALMEIRRNRALAQAQNHQEAKKLTRMIADQSVVDADFHEVDEGANNTQRPAAVSSHDHA